MCSKDIYSHTHSYKMPIYVIGQTNNKYIVVLSNETDGNVVLQKMIRELGTLWTILNRPYYIEESYPDKDEWEYEDMVLQTMAKYGIDNVRGGSYQDNELSDVDMMIVNRQVRELY